MGVRVGNPSALNTSPLFVTKISNDLTTLGGRLSKARGYSRGGKA